jgi:hypothetical protein
MDVVSITSIFARGLIGRFVNRSLETKLGFNPDIKLKSFNFKSGETVHADLSLEMTNEQFEKLMGVIFDE